MAASATVTYAPQFGHGGIGGCLKRVTIDWQSNTSGAVSVTLDRMVGSLCQAIADPDATDVPTNLYDVAITDDEGIDILANTDNALRNLSSTLTQRRWFFVKDAALTAQPVRPIFASARTVAVTNAGDSKKGQLILFIGKGYCNGSHACNCAN